MTPETASELDRIRQRHMTWTDAERTQIRGAASAIGGNLGGALKRQISAGVAACQSRQRAARLAQGRAEHAEAVVRPKRPTVRRIDPQERPKPKAKVVKPAPAPAPAPKPRAAKAEPKPKPPSHSTRGPTGAASPPERRSIGPGAQVLAELLALHRTVAGVARALGHSTPSSARRWLRSAGLRQGHTTSDYSHKADLTAEVVRDAVARHGSMRAAAKALGCDRETVANRMGGGR